VSPAPERGSWNLRRMVAEDVAVVHALERRLFPVDAWPLEMFFAELAQPVCWYWVAEQDGAVVGYAGLVCTGAQADVQTVAVAAGQQGRGLGGELLRALLAEARRRGATEVLLEVRAENTVAQQLYARHGFERIGVRRGYYRPGGTDAQVLRLRLGSDP